MEMQKKRCQNVETFFTDRRVAVLQYSNVRNLYLFLNLEVFQNVHESMFRLDNSLGNRNQIIFHVLIITTDF
jgi:hypothetical protein